LTRLAVINIDPFMKIMKSAALAASLLFAVFVATNASALIDDLSSSKVGKLPRWWKTWPMQREKAERVYSIGEENGKRFIRAHDADNVSQQLFINFHWPIAEKPMLSWKWRATKLPDGGNESNDATNDSACGVYVVVGKYSGHAIKYVWSTTLAPGTVVSRRDGKLKIKVVDSGPQKMADWVWHKLDVRKDYEKLFGKKLDKNPSGIAILTDGNNVGKPAGCDYADFDISAK